MDPKTIEWSKLEFKYSYTPFRFQARWKDGQWDEGKLITENKICIDEGATCLHYGQQIFEGMKAQRTKAGRIMLFRPLENADRFRRSAARLFRSAASAQSQPGREVDRKNPGRGADRARWQRVRGRTRLLHRTVGLRALFLHGVAQDKA